MGPRVLAVNSCHVQVLTNIQYLPGVTRQAVSLPTIRAIVDNRHMPVSVKSATLPYGMLGRSAVQQVSLSAPIHTMQVSGRYVKWLYVISSSLPSSD